MIRGAKDWSVLHKLFLFQNITMSNGFEDADDDNDDNL